MHGLHDWGSCRPGRCRLHLHKGRPRSPLLPPCVQLWEARPLVKGLSGGGGGPRPLQRARSGCRPAGQACSDCPRHLLRRPLPAGPAAAAGVAGSRQQAGGPHYHGLLPKGGRGGDRGATGRRGRRGRPGGRKVLQVRRHGPLGQVRSVRVGNWAGPPLLCCAAQVLLDHRLLLRLPDKTTMLASAARRDCPNR